MITDNLKSIQSKMVGYTARLIAVSKQQPDNRIDESLDLGIRIFGENKVQEAQARWLQRREQCPDLELHLIGPLQTNKVKDACNLFDVIHTLDRKKLARKIHDFKPRMPCFIQVNTGNEPQKSGVTFEELNNFYQFCIDLGMNIVGLMCIPPVDDDPEIHFELLSRTARELGLKDISMGMSDDYELALHYGATYIRVGSGLFGKRPT